MNGSLTQYLSGVPDGESRRALRFCLGAAIDRLSCQALTSAGLAINAGGAAFPKIGATAFYASVQGDLVTLAAGAALPAPTGVTTAAGGFNVVCYFVDNSGTITVAGGGSATTLAGVNWPTFPQGKALIGVLLVSGAGAFNGGTTALDAATTVYLNPVGAFDPTALL